MDSPPVCHVLIHLLLRALVSAILNGFISFKFSQKICMGMMMNPIDIGENPCNIAHFIAQNVVHLAYFDLVSAIEGKIFMYEGIQMIPIEIGHDLNDIAHFIVQDIVQ